MVPGASQITHASLLSRVRDPANHAAWREFESRYGDLLVRFCRKQGLQQADAEDAVQLVMASMARTLPGFVYDRSRGRFRDYLYRSARNAISRVRARPVGLAGALDKVDGLVADASAGDPAEAQAWEREWVAHHYRRAMQTLRQSMEISSVEVFERILAGESAAAIAASRCTTPDAVFKVRQRVRARLEAIIAEQVREEERVDD